MAGFDIRDTMQSTAVDRGLVVRSNACVLPVPPSNINIDTNCTVRNLPASNPSTQFVNTAKRDFGTFEIATP